MHGLLSTINCLLSLITSKLRTFSITNLPYFDSPISDLSYFGLWGLYLAPLGMFLPVTYLFTLSHADYVLARTVRDRRDRGHQSVSSLPLQTTRFQRAPDLLSSFSMSLRVQRTLYQLLTPAMSRERPTFHFHYVSRAVL